MGDRIGTHDKHVTVTDAVTVCEHSDIATVTVTGSDCTGANRLKIILKGDKPLSELYRYCKAHFEGAKRPFMRFAK